MSFDHTGGTWMKAGPEEFSGPAFCVSERVVNRWATFYDLSPSPLPGLSSRQLYQQFIPLKPQVLRHVLENSVQCADPER
jgi:hypothetical protein